MTNSLYGVAAVGNALVDVIAQTDEAFIQKQHEEHGMVKGMMTLVHEERALSLYESMGPGTETSGGSAANTMAGFASFGGKAAFMAKVADDQLGQIFQHDIRSLGINFTTPALKDGPSTGRCMILVTPDGQRTMNTFLGASVELDERDIDEAVIAAAQVTYLEGYLFDRDQAKAAFVKASEYAHRAGKKVALTLSDPFCVGRHRDDFLKLVKGHVDILFANELELKSLIQEDDFDTALAALSQDIEIAAVTRSEKGAVIRAKDETFAIPAQPVSKVVDTTGAGDQFAAGFLYGFTEGMSLQRAGELGTIAASEVISHIGPRPLVKLADLLKQAA
ncbi:MAG: adenosine kinase [Alphaproteobacteria bacterium]|nr:adenosine kinase [Alphaproteobacteria bacterium]